MDFLKFILKFLPLRFQACNLILGILNSLTHKILKPTHFALAFAAFFIIELLSSLLQVHHIALCMISELRTLQATCTMVVAKQIQHVFFMVDAHL